MKNIKFKSKTLHAEKAEELKINGKLVGHILNGYFLTKRTVKQYSKKFKGYGFSVALLKELERRNIKEIRLLSRGHNNDIRAYITSVKNVYEKGIPTKNEQLMMTVQGALEEL